MKKIFLFFTYFCLITSSFSSIFAMGDNDIAETMPLQGPRQHSLNADDENSLTRRQKIWRIISCCYTCPAFCDACKDPSIIGSDSFGNDVYNSRTEQPVKLTIHLPQGASDSMRERNSQRLEALNSFRARFRACISSFCP